MTHQPTLDLLAKRKTSIQRVYAGLPTNTATSWAYASVAREYADTAQQLPPQRDTTKAVLTARKAVRRHLDSGRRGMIGDSTAAMAALEHLGRVLDEQGSA
jgi:hypothetical protein